jgi:hypothetical protein
MSLNKPHPIKTPGARPTIFQPRLDQFERRLDDDDNVRQRLRRCRSLEKLCRALMDHVRVAREAHRPEKLDRPFVQELDAWSSPSPPHQPDQEEPVV